MHHCLQIQEILGTIFEFVLTNNIEFHKPSLDRHTVLALAKTCRTFSGPALQVLWRTLYTPVPLILNMPYDLWEIETTDKEEHNYFGRPRTLTFKRDIMPGDWERFDAYAPFVRQLGFIDRERAPVNFLVMSESICRALEFRNTTNVLLPNLKSVNASSNDLAYIALFLTPRVQYVKLTMHPSHIASLLDLSAKIPLRAPEIKYLHLVESTPWKTAQKDLFTHGLYKLLGALDLEEFSCDFLPLDDDMMWSLLSMPSLHVISICRELIAVKRSLLTHPLKEPQITKFSVRSENLGANILASVARLLLPSKLTVFRVTVISASSLPIAEELTQFMVVIGTQCSPSLLTELMLDITPRDLLPLQESPLAILTFDMLKPLLPFSNLSHLSFSAHPLDLTDQEVKQIAMAWPRLEDLYVETSQALPLKPRTSLRGLLWLATYCKHLRTLEYRFSDAGDEIPREEVEQAADHGLSFLSVGRSLIEDPGNVHYIADFFNHVFPSLSLLMWTHHDDAYASSERWSEVQAQIQRP